jgi:V/A-type H+-transporting ATPase subunit K
MNGKQKFYLCMFFFQFFLIFIVFIGVHSLEAFAQESGAPVSGEDRGIIAIAASLSVGIACIGAAIAIKTTGTAAISILSENQSAFFKAFLVVALCEAIAVYGLIIGIFLVNKI